MEAAIAGLASALVQDLVGRINSLVSDELYQAKKMDNAQEEVQKLKGKLLIAQALVDSSTQHKASQYLIGEVTTISYNIEDLADDIEAAAAAAAGIMWEKLLSFFSRGSMARNIQELEHKLDVTIQGLRQMNDITTTKDKGEGLGDREYHLPRNLRGRDLDREMLIAKLLDTSISSVSIEGMAGLGKTTLAHIVSNDPAVTSTFEYRLWVKVSGTFDIDAVCESISITQQSMVCEPPKKKMKLGRSNGKLVHLMPLAMFEGQCVLIVLDDIWDLKHDEWDKFRTMLLPFNRCTVLVTTRNSNVAVTMEAFPYHLQLIEDDVCGEVIMDVVLCSKQLSDREVQNKKKIVGLVAQKCKGLPLAAHKLGVYLSSKREANDWMIISKIDMPDLAVFKDEIFPAFKLDNPPLASHLRRCLAYCSLFPPNYTFNKQDLVQMWMAEGFIPSQRTSCLEEIGCHDYFNELFMRSIFQVQVAVAVTGKSTYKMHDFIHWSAGCMASHIFVRLEEGNKISPPSKARHLALLHHTIHTWFLKEIEKCVCLRTFLLLSENRTKVGQIPYSLFERLQRLRVLSLSRSDIEKLPESISTLKRLQYLDVSGTNISKLPESTSDLHGLKTLKLRECPNLVKLPENTKDMSNLVHLDVEMKKLERMPAGIGSLTSLQTLDTFVVGRRPGNRIDELKNLNALRGALCLSNLGNVRDRAEAMEAKLCEKNFINKLELEWKSSSRYSLVADQVLTGLQPHENVDDIKIRYYAGSSFPDWLVSPSFRLVSVHLQDCPQDTLPALGQLPFLENVHIEDMHNIKYIDVHFCAEGDSNGSFPTLKSLKIGHMSALEQWRLPSNSMTGLQALKIEDCPKLFYIESLNHMRSLQELAISFCEKLKSLPEIPGSLQSLTIAESDLLKDDYKPPNGPKWDSIKDIPNVDVDT